MFPNDLELTPIVVAAISSIFGLISGGLGSLIAPWANWGVEKRRLRVDRQRNIIDNARRNLTNYSREQIRNSAEYAAIRSHLSADVVNKIEARNTIGGEQSIHANIMQELSELERKWKLL
jgi:hypothetical protein